MSAKPVFLALACTAGLMVMAAGCSIPQTVLRPAGADPHVHAHSGGGIPTSPGAPSFGQQPLLPPNPAIAGKPVPLTLLYTADIHSRVEPFPQAFYHRTYAGKGGFARIATMSREARSRNANTLLLDSGDYLQGSPYFNFYKGEVELKAMRQVPFDAITIGNHEFDNGVAPLRKVLGLFSGPIVSSNVTFSPDLGQRYAVLQAGPLRVGLFGLLTEVSGLITPPNFQTARYYDPIAVARQAVAKLEKEADVIVAMSHVGIVPPWSEEDEPAAGQITDETIAQRVPGIDVILSGHTHAMVSRPIQVRSGGHETLIVAPGYGGGFLGQLNLTIRDGQVVSHRNDLLPLTDQVRPAADVDAIIAPYRNKMNQTLKRNIGRAIGTFGRYSGQDYESSLNNLIADATLHAARQLDREVSFGMSSSGTPRNFIMQGAITVEDVFYALPFDNKVVVVEAKGQTVLDMLSVQRRTTDNRRHAVSAGTSYVYDPASRSISDVIIDGQPFDPRRTYKVAVNDYMADGGSGFSMLQGLKQRRSDVLQRDALVRHIEQAGTLVPQIGRIQVRGRVEAVAQRVAL